ncbi:hypothetical protein QX233_10555 [Chryseobacterium gambrini]|uniref:Uncharacterized protein n=1 Tax=Chryseobacterium gambrini TaxID=373672 RepID=A0AAJ1VJE0_9FLAO|nr:MULTISPECIES: hypothetical protein [Chryseobacterium]MDN4012905.1 hypothetical protein [Chryseobacterium gambrini]MDN4030586.1 hypothetical protein [Chryseobacterium gambrini]
MLQILVPSNLLKYNKKAGTILKILKTWENPHGNYRKNTDGLVCE